MKLNVSPTPIRTHEGAKAKHVNPELQLRRSVMACMLWESEFYEDGSSVAARIKDTIPQVAPEKVVAIAIEAREKMKLRHVPLLIVREMARLSTHRGLVADTLARVIQRPDELSEFIAIYFKDKRQPLSAQVKRGLAAAFQKFNGYSLAKYNRDGAVKLRDVLFMCHAKPKDDEQAALWKQLVDGTLAPPDTWEVALSGGVDKKEAWTRLLSEQKLGALALLRNLRNMEQAGIGKSEIRTALKVMKSERVLPFRFIAAARHAPQLEPDLESAMFKCLVDAPRLTGETALLVDVSGSMDSQISGKSDLKRSDAAYALAMLLREICEEVSIYSFSMKLCRIPNRRGFSLRDAIHTSQEHGGTPLGEAVRCIYASKEHHASSVNFGSFYGNHPISYNGQSLKPDRLIVITDEQACDPVPDPATGKGYMINVASAKNGVGYGAWTHIDGWSEACIDFIQETERL